ncbi:hypothetical protein BDV35DRAFT_127720 [Aspergillus flavus]|uniref:Uncharacterized protein n=1 Tax=Aspergillus flavus TaxID=5059 RepID=A0A5N6HEY9_ASPFL|nr:hypothetical protein BDV35DRAFT_127720 [Aspergillus flavus]
MWIYHPLQQYCRPTNLRHTELSNIHHGRSFAMSERDNKIINKCTPPTQLTIGGRKIHRDTRILRTPTHSDNPPTPYINFNSCNSIPRKKLQLTTPIINPTQEHPLCSIVHIQLCNPKWQSKM